MSQIAVLIPAYNEEDRVADTVRAVSRIPGVGEIIVIDDGSKDETAKRAREAGAQVIQLDRNRGKGAALNAGLAATKADIILMLDADLGSSASEASRLLEPILRGEAEMSIAVLKTPAGHRGGFGCVMKLAKWAVRKYGGANVRAALSGQRAVHRTVLEDIGGFAEGFGVETALTIDALRKGYRLVEIELPLTHRYTGRDWQGFVHRFRQFLDILKVAWQRRRKEF
ncbi:MAG: glycosyltransferase family 2 protein [Armatimonadetes bacterium]|nr:glycosyltransferase family 2 protein [Armatimonadota bacterium]